MVGTLIILVRRPISLSLINDLKCVCFLYADECVVWITYSSCTPQIDCRVRSTIRACACVSCSFSCSLLCERLLLCKMWVAGLLISCGQKLQAFMCMIVVLKILYCIYVYYIMFIALYILYLCGWCVLLFTFTFSSDCSLLKNLRRSDAIFRNV